MEKKVSTLTLKLDEVKTKELEEIKAYIHCKTSSGAIKQMMERYILLEKEVIKLRNELRCTKESVNELERSTHDYFDSMNKLMRMTDYQHKL